MHIAILFQHYHTPDCSTAARPYSLVKRLAQEFDVTLIAGSSFQAQRLSDDFEWVPEGVRLVEVDAPYDNTMGTVQRVGSFVRYAAESVVRGMTIDPPDLVIGSSTPISVACAARVIAGRFRVPWIFEVRDLWPEFPIQMGVIPEGIAAGALRWLELQLYESAAHIITASPDMETHVRQRSDTPATTISYGTDFEMLERSKEQDANLVSRDALQSQFLVSYTGRFGRSNAIPSLLKAIEQLAGRSDITFALAGDGYYADTVRKHASRQKNLVHLGSIPYLQALALLRRSSLSLVPFLDLPVLSANAPSKLFDSLAAGTPVLVTNPGWTAHLVEEHNCGWVTRPEDPAAMAQSIARALASAKELARRSTNAKKVAADQFNRQKDMDRMVQLVHLVIGEVLTAVDRT